MTGSDTYQAGASVIVTATAASGYEFKGWTENGSQVSTSASYTFTINTNRILTAIFEEKEENPPTPPTPTTYTISVNASPVEGGSVSGGDSYNEGEPVTITATPNNGYKFVEWQLNGSQVSINPSYTFTASASQTFTAIFEKVDTPTPPEPTPTTYTISVNASPTGGGTVSGVGSFTKGTSETVTAAPNAG